MKKIIPYVLTAGIAVGASQGINYYQQEEPIVEEIEFVEETAKAEETEAVKVKYIYKLWINCESGMEQTIGGGAVPEYTFFDHNQISSVTFVSLTSPFHYGQEERLKEFNICSQDFKVFYYELVRVLKES